jgi:hypothetical protein
MSNESILTFEAAGYKPNFVVTINDAGWSIQGGTRLMECLEQALTEVYKAPAKCISFYDSNPRQVNNDILPILRPPIRS